MLKSLFHGNHLCTRNFAVIITHVSEKGAVYQNISFEFIKNLHFGERNHDGKHYVSNKLKCV